MASTPIHLQRDIVRRSADELSKLPGWQRHPRKSLKELIYGLNSIFDRFPFLRYQRGFPRPSVAVRELGQIQALCNKFESAQKRAPLMERIEVLIRRDTDSYGLLLFQAALLVDKYSPERSITDGRALASLREAAQLRPRQLFKMTEQALEGVLRLASKGRGGDRYRGRLSRQDAIHDLGILFENVTDQSPGMTYKALDSSYSGHFAQFVRIVFDGLGLKVNARQVYRDRKAAKDRARSR